MQNTTQEHPRHAARMLKAILKGSVLFLSLAGIIVFARVFELDGILDPEWADSHLRHGGSGILLYLALVALFSAMGAPRQALSALGGYAFGAAYGLLWASIGLVAGCACGFFYSRILGRSALQRKFGKRIQRLDAFLSRSPFAMTVAIRCFPMGNNALTNLAAGVTTIPALSFIGGSAIGYLPQTIIFTLLGSGIRIDPVWRTSLSAVLFVLSSIIGYSLYRRFKGEQTLMSEQEQAEPASQTGKAGSTAAENS